MTVEEVNLQGEIGIVNSARVSYNKEITTLREKDHALIEYLRKHRHTSPFMHPQIVFKIKDNVCLDELRIWKAELSQCDIQGIEFSDDFTFCRTSELFHARHFDDIDVFYDRIDVAEIPLKKENARVLFMSFKIHAPIFVARQLVKHRVGLAWNEISLRYVEFDEDLQIYLPKVLRKQSKTNKQSSFGVNSASEDFLAEMLAHYGNSFELYHRMLEHDIPREQARGILPLNTMTKWVWTGSLEDFARVCKLRVHKDAQEETSEVAEQIKQICQSKFRFFKSLISNV